MIPLPPRSTLFPYTTLFRFAVVIGRSILVGKPLLQLLLAANATVTQCHSRTRDLPAVCREADVLVAAVGSARLVDRKSTRLNSSHANISYAVFCLKQKHN